MIKRVINEFYLYIFLVVLMFISITHSFAQSRLNGDCRNVKIGGGGFVTSILAHPAEKNIFYCRTDVGGAYRWDESSRNWISMLDWVDESSEVLLGVESVAVDPKAPNVVYMTSGLSGYGWPGASLLISEDYGITFDIIPMDIYIHGNGMGRQSGEKLLVDPNKSNKLFLGTRNDGLLISQDKGRTWNKNSNFPVESTPNLNGISFVIADESSSSNNEETKILIAGVSRAGENMYQSFDAGLTWSPINNAPEFENIMPQRAVFSDDFSKIFITYANGAGPHPQNWDGVDDKMNRGAVFMYDLNSKEWKDISPLNLLHNPDFSGCYGGITIGHNKLYVTTINHWSQQQFYEDGSSSWGDRIYVSENEGQSWSPIFDGQNKGKLNTNNIPWIAGHNLHWVGSITLDPFNEDRIFLTSGNGVFMSENITDSKPIIKFHPHGIEETVPLDMMHVPGGPFVSIIGDYDGWIHEDVDKFPTGLRHAPNMGTSTGISFAPIKSSVWARCGSQNSVIYYTLNSGKDWLPVENLPIAATNGKVAINYSDEKPLICWIPDNHSDKIYITSNFGANWTNVWNNDLGSVDAVKPYPDPFKGSQFYFYNKTKGNLNLISYKINAKPEVTPLSQVGSGGSTKLAISLNKEGKVYIAMGTTGLLLYENDNLSTVSNINAYEVALGTPAPGLTDETIFVWGTHRGITGLFRSVDKGKTWFLINDENHIYGGLGQGSIIVGDQNIFGRVYFSTPGRGIVVCDSKFDILYLDPLDDLTSNYDTQLSNSSPIFIYPNPSSNIITLESHLKLSHVEIYNISGVLVKKIDFYNTKNSIDIKDLQKGKYYLKANDDLGNYFAANFIKI